MHDLRFYVLIGRFSPSSSYVCCLSIFFHGLSQSSSSQGLFLAKVKVKVTLEKAMKAQRGSEGMAVLFL